MDSTGSDALNYSLSLALSDYIPVSLGTAALLLLASSFKPGTTRTTLYTASALVLLGGAAKATWKLCIALNWGNFELLNQLLFVGLASGFSLYLMGYVHQQHSQKPIPSLVYGLWLVIAACSVYSLIEPSNGLRLALIGITALGATGLGAYLCWQATNLRSHSAWSLGLHTLLMLGMNAIARQLGSEESAQWQAQALNTLGQGLLLLGVWQYLRDRQREEAFQ